MALLERTLEKKIADELDKVLQNSRLNNYQFVCGRDVSDLDTTLNENPKYGVIAVVSSFRKHQNFTIPLVDVPFAITIVTRSDMERTGELHESTIEKIGKWLSQIHNSQDGIDVFQTQDFFPGALNITGGTGRTFDDDNGCWRETITIEINGTENY